MIEGRKRWPPFTGELPTVHIEQPKIGWHIFWSVILTYIACTIITAVLASIVGGVTGKTFAHSLLNGSAGQFLDAVVVFIAAALYRDVRTSLVQAIQLAALRRLSAYFYGAIGWICLYMISFLMIEFWQFEAISGHAVTMWRDTVESSFEEVGWLVALIIVGPIKEEVMFRGFLYRFLADRLHPVIGMLGSSVLFGIMHPGYPISSVLAGCVFCLLYQRTSSLAMPILLHTSWNAYVIFL